MPYKDIEKRRARKRAYYAENKAHILAYQRSYRAPKRHEEARRYRAAHHERMLAYERAYRVAHQEQVHEKARRYREKHPDKVRETWRKHHVTHRATRLARDSAYKAAHRAVLRVKERAYLQLHPDVTQAKNRRQRARRAAVAIQDLTRQQWHEIKQAYGQRCVYCGQAQKRLTMDHITPLALGGHHTVSNVVPACSSCNSRKQDGPPLCPVQPLLLTIASSKRGDNHG